MAKEYQANTDEQERKHFVAIKEKEDLIIKLKSTQRHSLMISKEQIKEMQEDFENGLEDVNNHSLSDILEEGDDSVHKLVQKSEKSMLNSDFEEGEDILEQKKLLEEIAQKDEIIQQLR